jgi:outer membrane protein assembly factor BamD (BamD/ComL family)
LAFLLPRLKQAAEGLMSLQKQTSTENRPVHENSLVEWFLDDFVPRYGKQALIGLLGILVAVLGYLWFKSSSESQAERENKELGPAYVYYSQDKLDSAAAFLATFVQKSHSRPVQDKANLLLGKIMFAQGKYDEAIKAYGAVDVDATDRPLVASGALHGLASSHIQKKEYPKAAELLEKFVSKFGRRTGAPEETLAGQEVVDLSPVVPNALWKLALVYRELKQDDKAKATAEKLLKIYPQSREAFDATRMVAQLTASN